MSNASNLSTLANVLDDGTSGQFLKSTGSGGVAFDTVAAGATVYSSASDLPLTGNTVGDMAYVSAATTAKVVNQTTGSVSTEDATRLYIYSGTGWYSVAFITQNPTISTVQDASSGTTPFTLATDQTATVITITAADPEEVPLTYGYSVTSGSLNGSTVAQGTGSNTNVFTVTPHASQDATFTITFTASDGINQATSANAFSLTFVTIVTDSNYTTLLATATGTSDNNNITDSSSNSHSITVNGDAHAGTFSPYRSGGYSTSFDGTNDYLQTASSDFYLSTSQFSVEVWIKPSDLSGNKVILQADQGSSYQLYTFSTQVKWYTNTAHVGNAGVDILSVGKWTHLLITRDSNNTLRIFADGILLHVTTNHTYDYGTNNTIFELGYNGSNRFAGEIRDARVISGSIPSEYQTSSTTTTSTSAVITVPTEPLTAVSGTKFLGGHLPYLGYTTASTTGYFNIIGGNPSTKPFSPYDYNEYSATDHGGSVFINAQGDQISATTTAIGSGTFTLEAWIYPTAQGGYQTIWASNYNSNPSFALYQNGTSINIWTVDSGGSNNRSTSGTIIENAWNHVVWQRHDIFNNNNNKVFLNGVETTSFTDSTNFSNTLMLLGSHNSTGSGVYEFHGYISDARFIRSAQYTSGNFIPPTTPLSSTGADTTPATLHLKGTDASIIDKSQSANLKLEGNTTGSTTQVKFSNTKSMYFDGTGDYIISQEPVLLGTQDFTVECWLYYQSGLELMGNRLSNGSGGFSVRITSTSLTVGNSSGTGFGSVFSGTTSSLTNAWHHIAVSRSSGVTKIYVDGSSIASHSSAIDFSLSNPFVIGYSYSNGSGAASIQGYIQDFRVTIGKPRYTADDETSNIPSSVPLKG